MISPQTLDNILFFACICLALIIGFVGNIIYANNLSLNPFNTYAEVKTNNSNCSNLDLINTSICLQAELKQFYKYNISNIGTELSLEALKKNGGVCTHYSAWYSSQAKALGFNTKEVDVVLNQSLNHRFTLISNLEGYCLLDQTFINCVPLDVPLFERLRLEIKQ